MNPSEFRPEQFAPGRRYELDLAWSAAGHELELPVLLVRGARPGPRLVATAGVHGDEYEGIRAIFEITRELDPAAMAGDLLAVPVANPPAFWNGSRTSPLDGENLARVFPGYLERGPTSALAWHLTHCILSHADFYIDLHSGGVQCLMPTMVGYDAADSGARAAAFAFGAEVVWAHPCIPPGRTVSAAHALGIPCLYTEARGSGRIDAADLAVYCRGLRNLLRHLGILPGEPDRSPVRYHLFGDGNIDQSLTATGRGFLVPSVELLDPVVRGQRLGTLLDLKGSAIEEYAAPCDGVVALIHTCPLVRPGEPLFLVTGLYS